jgi:hypothetical protein
VTRLGNISPFEWLLSLRSSEKIKEVHSHIFGRIFYHGNNYVLILTKTVLGYILGDFFTNSSGHPEQDWILPLKILCSNTMWNESLLKHWNSSTLKHKMFNVLITVSLKRRKFLKRDLSRFFWLG